MGHIHHALADGSQVSLALGPELSRSVYFSISSLSGLGYCLPWKPSFAAWVWELPLEGQTIVCF